MGPYQRQGEDRSQYIQHIIQYSATDYRIEVDESYIPEGEDRQEYYDAILAAYQLYLAAYFTALECLTAENDQALIDGTKQGTDTFIDTLYEEDVAASLGRQLFGDDFDAYFLDGFWRHEYYGNGLLGLSTHRQDVHLFCRCVHRSHGGAWLGALGSNGN